MRSMILIVGLVGASAAVAEDRASLVHVEFGVGGGYDWQEDGFSRGPSFLVSAAAQWRARSVPLGFEVRIDPAQFHPAGGGGLVGRAQLLGRYVSLPFEVALGVSGLENSDACELQHPMDGTPYELCVNATGVSLAGRVRVGQVAGHHLIVRGEAVPLWQANAPAGPAITPSLGAMLSFEITRQLHFLVDGEVRGWTGADIGGGHLDFGVRLHLGDPTAPGTTTLSARAGWQAQSFSREDPLSLTGPRLILGVEWNL